METRIADAHWPRAESRKRSPCVATASTSLAVMTLSEPRSYAYDTLFELSEQFVVNLSNATIG